MKKIFLTAIIFATVSISQESRASDICKTHTNLTFLVRPQTDTLLTYLSSLDLTYYSDKPVDSFLKKLPSGYSQMKVLDKDGSRYARYFWVKYDTIRIMIYVKEFHHLTPRNHDRNWDINLFRMENLACIEIWNRRRRVSPECKWWE